MNTENEANAASTHPKPLWLVLGALVAATAVSVLTGSMQQFGSLKALSNATVGSNLLAGAVGMIILLPTVHVGISSIWRSNRNSGSRRNIFFGWGVALTAIQMLILVSATNRADRVDPSSQIAPTTNSAAPKTTDAPKSQWRYHHKTNPMTGEITTYAMTDNKGRQSSITDSSLVWSESTSSNRQVYLVTAVLCSFSRECDVLVRFDDGEPVIYKGKTLGESKGLMIIDDEAFIAGLLGSKRVRISSNPYLQGNLFLEFYIDNLDEKAFKMPLAAGKA